MRKVDNILVNKWEMEKYRLVGEKRRDEGSESLILRDLEGNSSQQTDSLDSAEIKITLQGKPKNYITFALNLFSQGYKEIELKAMGKAINKAVTTAEILKRKLPLHQLTKLSSCEIIEVFEPLEEGLDVVEHTRYVSCMTIKLSKTGSGLDNNHQGYQPPLSTDEIQPGDMMVKPPEDTELY